MIVLSVTSQDAEKPIATLIHGAGGDELDAALLKLSRTIARQVVGFPTRVVSRKGEKDKELDEGEVLFEQPFMMMGEERKVGEVLEEWGAERGVKVKIVGMRRWSVSDPLEVKQELPETEDGA
jgi:elongation factor Ts